ncbi:hypothetical protein KEM55_004957 [Ascosphaera atra]|nr:hypothetical protein KEM55_004957 [Ascosphaera atra]
MMLSRVVARTTPLRLAGQNAIAPARSIATPAVAPLWGSRRCYSSLRGRRWEEQRKAASGPTPEELYNIPERLRKYTSSVQFPRATTTLKSLLRNPLDREEVVLHGYLGKRTDIGKKLTFVRLYDPEMLNHVQMIVVGKQNVLLRKVRSIEPHSPVAVAGTVKEKHWATKDSPAEIEIELADIQMLNDFPRDIIMTPETVFPQEKRNLQLRNGPDLRDALRFRSKVMSEFRTALGKKDPPFVEIETPLLFKSTPEGAREFMVPTRQKGRAYALPQSPQQYKQILMASGMPRYYQFAKCFRDEDLRADRQPEFTQLDMEMAFATGEDVMQVMERAVRQVWNNTMPMNISEKAFPRLTYEQAMSRYGSDKPDRRLGMQIHRVEHILPPDLIGKISDLENPIVECIKLSAPEDSDYPIPQMNKFLTDFMGSQSGAPFLANPHGQPGTFIYDPSKPLSGLFAFGFEASSALEEELGELSPGDLIMLQARPNARFAGGSTMIGDLRRAVHRAAVQAGICKEPTRFDFLWVHQFPLFSPNETGEAEAAAHPGQGGTAGFSATHHPFTAPMGVEDVAKLSTDPASAVADHYDLVVNGVELGGGSRRIHNAAMQEFVFRDILKMPEERIKDFEHLLEALRAGCPPHAGMAIGFDRLIAVMLGRDSVRDVIAFPKSGKGEDTMVKSPSEMTPKMLETYGLQMSK